MFGSFSSRLKSWVLEVFHEAIDSELFLEVEPLNLILDSYIQKNNSFKYYFSYSSRLTAWVLEVFHEAIDSEWSEELFLEVEPLGSF